MGTLYSVHFVLRHHATVVRKAVSLAKQSGVVDEDILIMSPWSIAGIVHSSVYPVSDRRHDSAQSGS